MVAAQLRGTDLVEPGRLAQARRAVPAQTLLQFERRGHCTLPALTATRVDLLKQLVLGEVAAQKPEALRHRVRVLVSDAAAQEVHSQAQALAVLRKHHAGLDFLQVFNLHRRASAQAGLVLLTDACSLTGLTRLPVGAAVRRRALVCRTCPAVRELTWQLAEVAAQLLGCHRLRLYQTSAFYKEGGYAQTHWHSDLRMAPLDTSSAITAWVPLTYLQARALHKGLSASQLERLHRAAQG